MLFGYIFIFNVSDCESNYSREPYLKRGSNEGNEGNESNERERERERERGEAGAGVRKAGHFLLDMWQRKYMYYCTGWGHA